MNKAKHTDQWICGACGRREIDYTQSPHLMNGPRVCCGAPMQIVYDGNDGPWQTAVVVAVDDARKEIDR